MRPWPAATATKTRLVIAPQWVGDAVMATPMMASLAQAGPLDVVCLPHLADLFQGMPFIRRVLPMAFARGRLQWFERRRQALGLIDAHYQQAIVCPNSWKAALLPWFANIPQRTGLVGEWRYGLLNDIRRPKASPDQLSVNQPALYASLADDAIAADALRLQQAPLLLAQPAEQRPNKPQLALCPGAEFGPAKQWPVTHYAKLAGEWLTAGGQVVVLGGPKDRGIGEAIVLALKSSPQQGKNQSDDCRMRAGQTSLAQAMTELAQSALVVSNDSGLMHVAAALGRPCLGLYGSTSEARTPAFGLNWAPLSISLPCRPCYDRQCRLGTTACLQELGPSRVIATARARGWWPDQLDLRHAH